MKEDCSRIRIAFLLTVNLQTIISIAETVRSDSEKLWTVLIKSLLRRIEKCFRIVGSEFTHKHQFNLSLSFFKQNQVQGFRYCWNHFKKNDITKYKWYVTFHLQHWGHGFAGMTQILFRTFRFDSSCKLARVVLNLKYLP